MHSRKIRTKRKLVTEAVLSELSRRTTLGVPLGRAVRDLDLDVTAAGIKGIVNHYLTLIKNKPNPQSRVRHSLFPEWLDNLNDNVQQNPDDWYYVGFFPYGKWHNDKND